VSKKKTVKKPQASGVITLSAHPRAAHQIRLAKGWAGLVAAVLAGYASWKGGSPFFDTALRAVLWGIAAYITVWFLAVQVLKHVVIAEVRAAEKNWLARKAKAEQLARERLAQEQALR
jgi:uncharacterized membrane protein